MSKLIKEILDALNAVNQNKTQPYDRQGEVKRIEGKTAWVKLEGSDRETPIQMTIACDVGDTVQARIGGGSAWLTGNLTAPPTDDKKANEAITMVTTVVQEVQEQVEEALEETTDVEDVTMQYCLSDSSSTFVQYGDWSDTPPEYVSGKYYWVRSVLVDDEGNETYGEPRYSQETQLTVETDIAFNSNNNHFWHDSSGAYVTTADKSYSSGYATRITSSGILQSYNGNLLSGWTNSGIAFYAGDGATASSSTTLASFGLNTIELGKNSTASSIYMCGGSLKVDTTNDYHDSRYYLTTRIINDSSSPEKSLYLQSGTSEISIEKSDYWGTNHIYLTTPGARMFFEDSSSASRIQMDWPSGQFRATNGNLNITASNGITLGHANGDLVLAAETVLHATTIKLVGAVLAGTLYSSDNTESSSATPNTHYGASSVYSGYYKIGLVKSSSSRRYKHDIKPIENDDLNPHNLYDLGVVQFVYNKDYLDNEKDDRYDRPVAGFVAEEMREIYPTAVDMENGRPETWNPRYIIPPMLALIQEQNKRITELEKRVL